MQMKALQVFCDIAQHRSFSKAAALHELTQPAASRIVHQLEEKLEVQLIDRSTRPLQLTELGKTFYEGCREVVDRFAELERSILRGRSQLATTVEVAAIYSVGFLNMNQYTERFAARFAPARVRVEYLRPDRVYDRVRRGAADIGLVSFAERSRDLIALPWREEPMVLACPPDHPLAHVPEVTPAHLQGARYVGFEPDLAVGRRVDQFLRKQGVTVEVVQRFDIIEVIKKDIEAGEGVALLPEPTLRQEIRTGALVARPLTGCPPLVRQLSIIHRRDHTLSPGAQHFIDMLCEGHNGQASPEARKPGGRRPVPANGRNGSAPHPGRAARPSRT
jgi:DNA-binding transcriptional LysR family regulator